MLPDWSKLWGRRSCRLEMGLEVKGLADVPTSLVLCVRNVRPLGLANSSMLYDRWPCLMAMGLMVKGLLLPDLCSGGRVLGGGVKGRRGPFLLLVS